MRSRPEQVLDEQVFPVPPSKSADPKELNNISDLCQPDGVSEQLALIFPTTHASGSKKHRLYESGDDH